MSAAMRCAPPRWVFVTSKRAQEQRQPRRHRGRRRVLPDAGDDAAMLPGTYKAWLTGSDPARRRRCGSGARAFTGWYRLRTNPPTGVAEGWADLTSPNEDVPPEYLLNAIYSNETGIFIPEGTVWTNTNASGMQQSPTDHCNDWEKEDGVLKGFTGVAKSDVLGGIWTAESALKCSVGARLYCMQTG
jgi:hypothetical protein